VAGCQSNGEHQGPEDEAKVEQSEPREENRGVSYVAEGNLPRHLAVMSPVVSGDTQLDGEMSRLIQGVMQNYLAGKGFEVVEIANVTRCEAQLQSKKAQTRVLSLLNCLQKARVKADGAVLSTVYEFATVNVGFLEHYALDAEVVLYTAGGEALGNWRDRATRRKVSVATDPLSAVLTLAASTVVSYGGVHKRNIIYDWAYNITALMPTLSSAGRQPQVLRVVTNVGEDPFKRGDQIAVGFEGDRGLSASFDLGEFRRDIPMAEKEPGVYVGTYVVREGDVARDLPLTLRLAATDGGRRTWPESERLVNIDGESPPAPQGLHTSFTNEGIALRWQTSDAEIVRFAIQRSNEPLAGYEEVAAVTRFDWQDMSVAAGETYFYRILAEDRAGNRSAPLQSPPLTRPLAGQKVLNGEIQGRLLAGQYRLKDKALVPAGRTLEIAPGVSIFADPGATLVVAGVLTALDASLRVVEVDSESDEVGAQAEQVTEPRSWQGVLLQEGGRVTLDKVSLRDCEICLLAKGTAMLRNCQWQEGGTGLLANTASEVSIEGGRFQRMDSAIVVEDGRISLNKTVVTKNKVGLRITGGIPSLSEVNIYDNGINLDTAVPLTLQKNFLGGLLPNQIGVKGPVTVRSLLDAPWPDGKEVVVDQDALASRAQEKTELGIVAFNEQRYGQAYEHLSGALSYAEDRTTRLYLTYVLSALGKHEELARQLEEGVRRYPYEIRFYNLAVRNLLASGRQKEAGEMLERALKLNPGNPTLEGLKTMLGNE
jgi:tetratricopeptide (TPR) repeat protein